MLTPSGLLMRLTDYDRMRFQWSSIAPGLFEDIVGSGGDGLVQQVVLRVFLKGS